RAVAARNRASNRVREALGYEHWDNVRSGDHFSRDAEINSGGVEVRVTGSVRLFEEFSPYDEFQKDQGIWSSRALVSQLCFFGFLVVIMQPRMVMLVAMLTCIEREGKALVRLVAG
ncbi:hypothetical protein, partial [Steroidobacter sp.]|uniref:hypothetical protein n=1 Tax=Steroidobacter sp. TaxID=1978227 RepID=UPI0025FEFBCE